MASFGPAQGASGGPATPVSIANGGTGASSIAAGVVKSNGTALSPSTGLVLVKRSVVSTGVTFTTQAGVTKVHVRGVGGGGGGGGTTTTAAQAAYGSGGGAGAPMEFEATVAPSTVYTIAIGAAGAAGGTDGSNGGNGGNTTFSDGSTTFTAPGGSGGVGQLAGITNTVLAGGAGGVAATNDLFAGGGMNGGQSRRASGTAAGQAGDGGTSIFGAGGIPGPSAGGAGVVGIGFGAGGGGGSVLNGSSAVAGGAGVKGCLEIYEYGVG